VKIAVIAANGRSGKIFVEEALKAGHSVRAGVHRIDTLTPHPHLTIVSCDATKQADLRTLFEGQEAVTSFLGHTNGSPRQMQTTAIQAAQAAMQECGIHRIVSLTGTGVRFPGDVITPLDRLLNFFITIIDPARIHDGRDHVEALKQSDLDWTVIRVLKLLNGPMRSFKLLGHGPTKWFVSRREVPHAVLEVLDHHSFIREAPIIGKERGISR
jgi:putative NADH-flavin reductase